MKRKLLIMLLLGTVFLISCTSETNISTSTEKEADTYDFSEYNGRWDDAEFVDDSVTYNSAWLSFEQSSNKAKLQIEMGEFESEFIAITHVEIDSRGIGQFTFTDEKEGLVGSGVLELKDKSLRLELEIQDAGSTLSKIYNSERILIRDPHEGQVFTDPYELLTEITGYKNDGSTELIQDVGDSEGFKEWIMVISVMKDGKVYKKYLVDTLKHRVEEW